MRSCQRPARRRHCPRSDQGDAGLRDAPRPGEAAAWKCLIALTVEELVAAGFSHAGRTGV